MNDLKFPEGWFTRSEFNRLNGFTSDAQRNLLTNLTKSGALDRRTALRKRGVGVLYRQVHSPERMRETTYSADTLRNLFGMMGMNEMPVLTNETQPV
jgi:catalase (peroxidase I)